ncbi:hypothetical protein Tco_1525942 [Tanacetum coccineum]
MVKHHRRGCVWGSGRPATAGHHLWPPENFSGGLFQRRPKKLPHLPIYSIPTPTLGHAPSPPPLDHRCHTTATPSPPSSSSSSSSSRYHCHHHPTTPATTTATMRVCVVSYKHKGACGFNTTTTEGGLFRWYNTTTRVSSWSRTSRVRMDRGSAARGCVCFVSAPIRVRLAQQPHDEVTTGSVIVTPGSIIMVTPGSVIVTTGSVIVTPGSIIMVTPGSVIVTTGSVIVTSDSVIVTTGSVIVTPGSVIVSPGSANGK